MPAPKPITTREKAVIVAMKLGIIPDQITAYKTAADKPAGDVNTKGIATAASRWLKQDKIMIFAEYIDRLLSDRDADARERGRQEEREGKPSARSDRSEGKNEKSLDFYDPANQRRQINKIIQESSDDPKTQLDAIKAIQQTQRDDRQAARDQKQVQTYLPLRCESCPLMEKARKKA